MKQRRFQNQVAESVLTLPVSAVLTVIVWWWPQGSFSIDYLLGLLCCAFTAYVILETNNANALIRVRTRLVSCLWIILTACMGFLHSIGSPLIAAACTALSYSQLCQTYQRHDATIQAFHANLFLALGSLAFPSLLLLALLYVIYFAIYMRCVNLNTILASVVALLAPYWLWAGWCVWNNDFSPLLTHLSGILDFQVPTLTSYTDIPLPILLAWGLVCLLSLVGTIHYLRNRYDDKIKVRMLLYVFVCQTLVFQVAIILQPQLITMLLPLLLVSSTPLIAHYFALTHSRVSNVFFCLAMILTVAVAAINLWIR